LSDIIENSVPLVSVTSAFYNEGTSLMEMIQSIQAQTFDDWELVLLDDGSTDNSLEVARSIRDPRIRVFTNEKNLGRSASLNKLTTLARGRYIARMDADDMCAPTRLKRQVDYLDAHCNVDLVGTGIIYIHRNGEPMGCRQVPTSHADICHDPSRMLNICHGSILARRDWLERFSYDESISLSVDQNLFFRAHTESTFANLDEPLYYYCIEPSFTLKKQWVSRRINAKYLFKSHRRAGHITHGMYHWGMQHLKFGVFVLACVTGQRNKLLKRRFQSLSDEQKATYLHDLARIREQTVNVCDLPRS